MKLVLDTDVIVAALRSPTGASAELVRLARHGAVRPIVTVPLVLEYEAVMKRGEHLSAGRLEPEQADVILNMLIACAEHVDVHFTYRPLTRDPGDEMVLEAAINGQANAIVTFNRRDFGDAPARFGIGCWLPRETLEKLR